MEEGDVVNGALLGEGRVVVVSVVPVVPTIGGGRCSACTGGDNECNSGVCSRGEPKGESKGECKAVCNGEWRC